MVIVVYCTVAMLSVSSAVLMPACQQSNSKDAINQLYSHSPYLDTIQKMFIFACITISYVSVQFVYDSYHACIQNTYNNNSIVVM